MKKWAESTQEIIPVNIINDMLLVAVVEQVEQVEQHLCDGQIVRTKYHDGTNAFKHELLAVVGTELMATHVEQIGTITLTTDYVIADMKYGESKQVARDTIVVPFVFT